MGLEMETAAGREGLAAIRSDPGSALVAFDYDGTLAPIVTDPTLAVPHPGVVDALRQLTLHVGQVAIVTGRPGRQAVDLAGFDGADGLGRLVVLGHYGLERWDAATGEVHTVQPAVGLKTARETLAQTLSSLGLGAAEIEDKGLSVAVHVRRLADPDAAMKQLAEPLGALAERCGLVAEPGKKVIELRPPGMDKGQALRQLALETAVRAVCFVGDDLGDLAAFDEVDRLRVDGVPGLLVCSGSQEEQALAARADLVVDGPAGVVDFISALVEQVQRGR